MSEGQPPVEITVASLRELYARLGLSPSEEEIAAALPVVQRHYDNDRLLEARVGFDVEPVPAPRLPWNGIGAGEHDGR